MPQGDTTGPYGAGSMTGRAMGYCTGYSVPGYINPRRRYDRGFGRGWGRGFGRGWGRDWYVYPPPAIIQPTYPHEYPRVIKPPTPEQEVAALSNCYEELTAEKTGLEKEIVAIKDRIEELKAKIENKQPQTDT
jgi:hypothetical protein